MISEGSAFLDRSGRVLVADPAFRACLGLPVGDLDGALHLRAEGDPALAAFVCGAGPDVLRVAVDGGVTCDLRRFSCEGGFLVCADPGAGDRLAHVAELAIQGIVLSRLAGSIAHEVKNPLNAMALQLALLGDKIASESDALASSCAGNLQSLKNQIGRVNEVVRRLVDVSDPPQGTGLDASTLASDVTSLLGHEARRRRIALSCEPSAPIHAAGDSARAARLVLALIWSALGDTPEGGRVVVRAAAADGEAVITIDHGRGARDASLSWTDDVIAAGAGEMGGRVEREARGDAARTALRLPRERAP
jgi:hypothetical protein